MYADTENSSRRKLKQPKLPKSFLTKRAVTMGVNAKRCVEYFEEANASFSALESGGSYAECEQVLEKFRQAQSLYNSSVASIGGPSQDMLAEGVAKASEELDAAKVREANAKSPKSKK